MSGSSAAGVRQSSRLQEKKISKKNSNDNDSNTVMLKSKKPQLKTKKPSKATTKGKSSSSSFTKSGKTEIKTKTKPTYFAMVSDAILFLNERSGSSRQAIEKYILDNFQVDQNIVRINIRRTLKKNVCTDENPDGYFVQTLQSFRLTPKHRRSWSKTDDEKASAKKSKKTSKTKTKTKKKTIAKVKAAKTKTKAKAKAKGKSKSTTKSSKGTKTTQKKKPTKKAKTQPRFLLKNLVLDIMKAHDDSHLPFNNLFAICLTGYSKEMDIDMDHDLTVKFRSSLRSSLRRLVANGLLTKNSDGDYCLTDQVDENEDGPQTEEEEEDNDDQEEETESEKIEDRSNNDNHDDNDKDSDSDHDDNNDQLKSKSKSKSSGKDHKMKNDEKSDMAANSISASSSEVKL